MRRKVFKLFALCIISLFIFTIDVKAATAITVNNSKKGTVDANSYYVTNTASLKVSNIASSSDTFKAYKILDTYYNSTNNTITYEFTNSFKTFLASSTIYNTLTVDDYYKLTSGSITSGSTKTNSSLDRLTSAYASYIKKNTVIGTDMSVSGSIAMATVDAGAYLVLPTLTNSVYAVMVGNLDFTATSGAWNLNNATIVAKVSEAGVTSSIGSVGYSEGSFTIGKEFSYNILATVPVYPTNATNKQYVIKSTMSNGITFSGVSSIVVKDGEATLTTDNNGNITDSNNHVIGKASVSGQTLIITFDTNYITTTAINISYKSKLNNNAILGSVGNISAATLTYSNDPYGTETKTTSEVNGKTTAYTYGIELLKYATGNKSTVLSGAVFDVYSDSALKDKVGTIITNTSGLGYLDGLATGTYYLNEVTAPAGYSLIDDIIEVKISTSGDATIGSQDGYYLTEVANSKAGILPLTGGTGTIIYIVIGTLLMVCAAVFAIIYHRTKRSVNSDLENEQK